MTDETRGDRIRRLREERGWTQEELGEKAGGINDQVISKYERNKLGISAENLLSLARALGVTSEFLYYGDDEPEAIEGEDPPGLAEFLAQWPRGQKLKAGLIVDRKTSNTILSGLRAQFRTGPTGTAEDYDESARAAIARFTRPLHAVQDGPALKIVVKEGRRAPKKR